MREWLVILRKAKGLSQKDMAERLRVSTPYYCLIENGKRQNPMSLGTAVLLSEALNLPLEQILKNEGY